MVKVTRTIDTSLEDFCRARLPAGLEAKAVQYSYSSGYVYTLRGAPRKSFFFGGYDEVVDFGCSSIDVYNPTWFSDFEDLAIQYEKATGKNVTIRVHEKI